MWDWPWEQHILPKRFIFSPYFSLSEVENFSKLHFFGEKLSRLAFFGEKLQKFANLGVKIEKKNRVKTIVICIFWG